MAVKKIKPMLIDDLNRLMLNRLHAGITHATLRIEDIQDLFEVLSASREVLDEWAQKEVISEESLYALKKAVRSMQSWK